MRMSDEQIDAIIQANLDMIASWETCVEPRSGHVLITMMPEPEKPVILRPDGYESRQLAETRRAVVVGVGSGDWSPDGSRRLEMDVEVGDGVYLVRTEAVFDGTSVVIDPKCPVELLAIHERLLVGKFNVGEFMRSALELKRAMDDENESVQESLQEK